MNGYKFNKFRLLVFLSLIVIAICVLLLYRRSKSFSVNIRNVLLISIDTCRADHLSCYGYPQEITPYIDEVAREGVLFRNTISPVPMTLPAHSSMFTGTNPPFHGVHANLEFHLSQSNVTLAEMLKIQGFTTAGIVGSVILSSKLGIDQGFDFYNDQFDEKHKDFYTNERKADEVSRIATEWLDEHKNERFFLFLHYFDPHTSYEPPEPYKSLFSPNGNDRIEDSKGLYAGEIAYTDYCIGQVIKKLKSLNLYDSTLIIITGDHGEMLGEHGEITHDYFIYQSAIKVPLIFKLPGQQKHKTVNRLVGLIDIVPTICGLLGIELSDKVHGIDLSGILCNNELPDEDRYIYCESFTPTSYNANPLLVLVTNDYKYILTTRPELYDLVNDPTESDNLVLKQPQRARILKDHLYQILEEQLRKNDSGSLNRAETYPEMRKRLASLGYVADSGLRLDFEINQAREDPKDLIAFHNSNGQVISFMSSKKYAEAKSLCEKLLKQRPDFFDGHQYMARMSSEQSDWSGAIPHLLQSLKLRPDHAETHSNLGIALTNIGRFEEALGYFRRTLQINPDLSEAHRGLGNALRFLNKIEESIKHYELALQSDSEDAETHHDLALALATQGRLYEALEHYRRALQIKPDFAEAHINMANVFKSLGQYNEAISHLQIALQINPEYHEAHYNLGNVLLAQGKLDQAIRCYRRTLELKDDYAEAYNNLGVALQSQGNFELAVSQYQRSIEIRPDYVEAHCNLGAALQSLGKLQEAADHFRQALQIAPDSATAHYNLGNVLEAQGNLEQALRHYMRAMQLKPNWIMILNKMAWIRATSRASNFRNAEEAMRLSLRACELTGYKNPLILDTLAAAYAEAGKFNEAIKTAEKGLELARSANQQQLVNEIKERLELYKIGQPYRERTGFQNESEDQGS